MIAVLLVLVGPAGPTKTSSTAIIKLRPEAATAVVVASDDGHEDERNMMNCI